MILKEFEYSLAVKDLDGIIEEDWRLENCNLGKANLIVGKNASGKTNVLYYIMLLAQHLSGKHLFLDIKYKAAFCDNDNRKLIYSLNSFYGNVLEESLVRDGQKLIVRNDKENSIYSEKEKKLMPFKPPKDKLTVEVRRNEEEYPYLEELISWGNSLYAFSFAGLPLYQKNNVPGYKVFFNDLDRMLDILYEKKIISEENKFKKVIIEDLNFIGYDIEDYYFLDTGIKENTLMIKEKGFKIGISHNSISAGMYRAFSILVIFNYYLFIKKPCTLIIDDLGEGLDFDRSSKLTKLLFNKINDENIEASKDRDFNKIPYEKMSAEELLDLLIKNIQNLAIGKEFSVKEIFGEENWTKISKDKKLSLGKIFRTKVNSMKNIAFSHKNPQNTAIYKVIPTIQLIVTSNDRFLMNAVDLEYWNVLDRNGHIVTSYNYENSKDTFEGFSFTGLNNFDFFAMEFYKGEDND